MESNGTSIFVVIFLAVLILSAVLIVWMFVSLVRSELEDERRQMIVGKASTWAFIAVVGGDLIEVIRTAVQQPSGEPASPFIQLARRYGVSRQTINAIENNKYDPTLTLAFHLAGVLGTTVDELFLGPGEKSC